MKIINLISGPRNLSTALMYSFAQRKDCRVLDEPYYGFYLKHGRVEVAHPSKAEIIRTMELSDKKVTENIKLLAETSHVFIKGMAHHYLSETPTHILNWGNVILIRHPKKLLASFSKVIENPTISDIGIKKASELFLFLKEHHKTPIVMDSDELLKNPEQYLRKLCELLKIPFYERMLHWKKGGIPEDGIWAKHWYQNVHNSEGFSVQKTSDQHIPERLQLVLDEALIYYNILKIHLLKND
ncbi:sulfotransferase family protein [Jejudonia soesokkakensis]|uniref:Sulfotransferase family protein n=1 Tax=Jejudonia soesokkakensis TaxID=1323432 RepID=A0ABW2MND6_9FLAO